MVIGLQAESLFAAADFIVQHHFQAFQAVVIFTDKADDLGSHRTVRIETAVFIAESQAVQLVFLDERFDGFIFFVVHLSVEPDEGRIFFQAPFNFILRDAEIRRQ